ncbi:MAG: hypothetical protein U0R71_03665 [Solirubrobacterales bacterium]
MLTLTVPITIFDELSGQMAGGREEQVAFLYVSLEGERLVAIELHQVPPEGFLSQSARHLALADEMRANVLGRAAALDACVVEAHSHPGAREACFSPTDLAGFEEWVPHVRWRLGGVPYAALVFAGHELDALGWRGAGPEPEALGHLEVGDRIIRPSNLTIEHLSSER